MFYLIPIKTCNTQALSESTEFILH